MFAMQSPAYRTIKPVRCHHSQKVITRNLPFPLDAELGDVTHSLP